MKGIKKNLSSNEKTKCFSPKKGWAKNQATKIKTTYKRCIHEREGYSDKR
jgi:hypothetical protein